MEKKYWFIFAAVVLFFGGAIWASEAPDWTTLAILFAEAGGFALGYFFNKSANQVKMTVAKENQLMLNKEIASLKDALKKVKAEAPAKTEKASKATKKNKE